MRVLSVTPWFPWPDNPIRGVWTIDHARAMALNHDVAVLAFRPMEGSDRPFQLTDGTEDGLRTLRLSYPPPRLPGLGMIPARAGAIAALERLAGDGFVPDVVQAHVFLAAPAALTAARRTGAPLVVLEHLTRITDDKLSRLERGLARYCYRSADMVCAVDKTLADKVRQLGARTAVLVPNVVDTDRFFPAADRREPAKGQIRAIAIGSLHAKKGHRYLLEAMPAVLARQPALVLSLIGDGPLRDELQAQAESLRIGHAVRFHGFKAKEEIAEMLRSSDLHVLPSTRENLPLAIAEAMASGIPTVGTSVGGVAEMLDERSGVVVPPRDPGALAAAILEVCSRLDSYDPQQIARTARERYGRDTVARRWSELFEEVTLASTAATSGAALDPQSA